MGAITKAGNARVRHVLVQAAWCYRRRPTIGAALRKRLYWNGNHLTPGLSRSVVLVG
jgi:transposase